MRHAASQHLYSYWNRLRRGRPAPERTEIDPAEIRHILAHTFILETDENATFPFRLSGARINALFDTDLKNRSFIDLWRKREAASMATLLCKIGLNACPIIARVSAAPAGYKDSAFELLLLPLWHHSAAQSRILGCLAGFDQPAWLGLLPVEHLMLRGLRQVQDKSGQVDRVEAGMAQKESMPVRRSGEMPNSRPVQKGRVFSLGGHIIQQYGHLRVYPGGRQDVLA